jgi:hypothetical protein
MLENLSQCGRPVKLDIFNKRGHERNYRFPFVHDLSACSIIGGMIYEWEQRDQRIGVNSSIPYALKDCGERVEISPDI